MKKNKHNRRSKNEGHMAQIIRRKMILKITPNKKKQMKNGTDRSSTSE